MGNKLYKNISTFIYLFLLHFQAVQAGHVIQTESVAIVALVGEEESPVTTIDIENYINQFDAPLTRVEALKAILIRKLFLLAVARSPFAHIHARLFNGIVKQEVAKINLKGASNATKKLVAQRVKEAVQIWLFKKSLVENGYITPLELLKFYKEKVCSKTLPKVNHQIVLQQIIIYIPKKKNIKEEQDFMREKIYQPLSSKVMTFDEAEELIKTNYPNQGSFKRYYATPQGDSIWLADNIPSSVLKRFDKAVKQWKVGDVSLPHIVKISSEARAIRIFYIKLVVKPHILSLQDYEMIMRLAMEEKKQKIINAWVNEQLKKFVRILDDRYADVLIN